MTTHSYPASVLHILDHACSVVLHIQIRRLVFWLVLKPWISLMLLLIAPIVDYLHDLSTI